MLNKIDALSEEELAEKTAALETVAGPVMAMSGAAHTGLIEVLRALRSRIDADRLRLREDKEEPETWQP